MLNWHFSSWFLWLILTISTFWFLEFLMNWFDNPLTTITAFYFFDNILLIHLLNFVFACIWHTLQVCTINVTNGVLSLFHFFQVNSFFGLLSEWSWWYFSLWFLWTWQTRISFWIRVLRPNRRSFSLNLFYIIKASN